MFVALGGTEENRDGAVLGRGGRGRLACKARRTCQCGAEVDWHAQVLSISKT